MYATKAKELRDHIIANNIKSYAELEQQIGFDELYADVFQMIESYFLAYDEPDWEQFDCEYMNKEQVIAFARDRMIKQGRASYEMILDPLGERIPRCRYRDLESRSCGVGCFLTEDEYDRSMEGDMVHDLELPKRLRKQLRTLDKIQMHHDHNVELKGEEWGRIWLRDTI